MQSSLSISLPYFNGIRTKCSLCEGQLLANWYETLGDHFYIKRRPKGDFLDLKRRPKLR